MCKQPVLAFYCSRPLINGDFISDFNSMKSILNSIPKNAIPNPIPIQMMAIPIPPGLGKANSNSIPIPELDLELARKSNSGVELTPTLT